MKKFLLILFLANPVFASGSKHSFKDPLLNDEFENNYKEHDFPRFVNATGSSMTVTMLHVSSMTLNGTNLTPVPTLTSWVAYTPTMASGFGTVTHIQLFWRQVGDTLEVQGVWLNGTVAATQAYLELPAGKNIDYSKCPNYDTDIAYVGVWYGLQNGAFISNSAFGPMFADVVSDSRVYFALNGNTSSHFVKANANAMTLSGQNMTVNFRVPIL